VIEEPRIEKINLTTGPMAITGSTRMQATSIQLCVLMVVMEMLLRELMRKLEPNGPPLNSNSVPEDFLRQLAEMHSSLSAPEKLGEIADWVALEEATYRSGHKNNYFADRWSIDVLTDTTERTPTYCTPAFRKFDDATATESWSFLFVNERDTRAAWKKIIKRIPNCIEWNDAEVGALVTGEKARRTREILRSISAKELMRFRIGLDGLEYRCPGA